MKSQLVDALKPTPDLVEGITNNPQLLAGGRARTNMYHARRPVFMHVSLDST